MEKPGLERQTNSKIDIFSNPKKCKICGMIMCLCRTFVCYCKSKQEKAGEKTRIGQCCSTQNVIPDLFATFVDGILLVDILESLKSVCVL